VYQDTNLFIILILSFVYYCLFKIIEEHLYNLYGDKISVYSYAYNKFRFYCLKFYDFGYSLLEDFQSFSLREVLSGFNKFFPLSLFFLFSGRNISISISNHPGFTNLSLLKGLLHSFGFWYLKFFVFFFLGGLKGSESFYYEHTKKIIRKSEEYKFGNFFSKKIIKASGLGRERKGWFLNFKEFDAVYKAPFFSKNVYYSNIIDNRHVLYQLHLLCKGQNLTAYDLGGPSVNCEEQPLFKVLDDTYINFSNYNFSKLQSIALKYHVKDVGILYNNLIVSLVEPSKFKNPANLKELYAIDDKDGLYKSHHVNTYIYIYNRSSKYLASGVPLNNSFASDRFLQTMSTNVKDTFSFYDVFAIFLDNIYMNRKGKSLLRSKALGDASTYVMMSDPSIASFLFKLGSFNHCQHSLENGP